MKNADSDQIQNGHLLAIIYFHMPNFCKLCYMLVHYYKTKCEVSGEDAPLHFLTSLYRIQNDRKSAIIYLDWPDIR